jgi:DNA-binding response OmpR family regulator
MNTLHREARPAAPEAIHVRPATRAKFVLLVAADPGARRVLAAVLEGYGYLVLAAGSAGDASDHLAVRPQVVVLELDLPGGDSAMIARWLAALDHPPPIIGLAPPGTDTAHPFGLTLAGRLPRPVAAADLLARVVQVVPLPQGSFGL